MGTVISNLPNLGLPFTSHGGGGGGGGGEGARERVKYLKANGAIPFMLGNKRMRREWVSLHLPPSLHTQSVIHASE